jgi:ribosomal protein S28E/S33
MGIFAHMLAGGAEGGFGAWQENIDRRIEDERAEGLLAKKEESLRNVAEHKEGLRRESEEIKSGREIVGYTEEGMPITRDQLGDLGDGENLGVYGSALGREVDKSSFSQKYVDSQGNVWAYDPKDPSSKYLLGPGKGSGGSGGGSGGGGGSVSAADVNAVRSAQESLIKQYGSWEKVAKNIKPYELDTFNTARAQLNLPPLTVEKVKQDPTLLQSVFGLSPNEEAELVVSDPGLLPGQGQEGAIQPGKQAPAGSPAAQAGGTNPHLDAIFSRFGQPGSEKPAPGPRRWEAEAATPPAAPEAGLLEPEAKASPEPMPQEKPKVETPPVEQPAAPVQRAERPSRKPAQLPSRAADEGLLPGQTLGETPRGKFQETLARSPEEATEILRRTAEENRGVIPAQIKKATEAVKSGAQKVASTVKTEAQEAQVKTRIATRYGIGATRVNEILRMPTEDAIRELRKVGEQKGVPSNIIEQDATAIRKLQE